MTTADKDRPPPGTREIFVARPKGFDLDSPDAEAYQRQWVRDLGGGFAMVTYPDLNLFDDTIKRRKAHESNQADPAELTAERSMREAITKARTP